MFQAAVDYFNPRTRVGCDDEMQWGNRFCQYFNPRTRVGCDITSVLPPERVYHFNPRTRVGCDHDLSDSVVLLDISIHAPAWGATVNSRSKTSCIPISIHAPAWGATSPGIAAPPVVFYFNPRTRVGCDAPINMGRIFFCLFQSTHPRGVRLSSYSLKSFRRNFNPRTRVGCDGYYAVIISPLMISIHAPAWGATISVRTATTLLLFQSTHPRGVRRVDIQQLAQVLRFQSTHPRGVRQSIL